MYQTHRGGFQILRKLTSFGGSKGEIFEDGYVRAIYNQPTSSPLLHLKLNKGLFCVKTRYHQGEGLHHC